MKNPIQKRKETFIIRSEWYESISKLNEKEQAIILRNLFEYHLGNLENINLKTLSLQLVWGLIEPNLFRNIEAYDRRCETSAENGKLGGRPPKKEKPKKPIKKPNKPIVTLSDTDSDPVSDPDSGSDSDPENDFDKFWHEYDKKIGDRQKLEKKWNCLTEEDKAAIFKYIPKYKEAQPDKKFRKNVETFLNNRAWNDEIVGAAPVRTMPEIRTAYKYDPMDRKNYWNDEEYERAMEKLKSQAS